MAQTIRVLNNVQIDPAGTTTASRNVPNGITDIEIQMVLATSIPNWDSGLVGTFEWAVEWLNPASGQWEILEAQDNRDGRTGGIPIGTRNARTGALPQMGITYTTGDPPQPVNLGGRQIRAFVRASVPVFCSFDIRLT